MLEDEETMLSDQAHQPTPTKSYWVNMSSECAHFCKHTMTFTTNKHSYKVCNECIEVHADAGSRVHMCKHIWSACARACAFVSLSFPLLHTNATLLK